MFIKDLPELTLQDLLETEVPPTRTFTVPVSSIRVHTVRADSTSENDAIRIGDRDYPFTNSGLLALGQWLDIPSTFLAERLPPALIDPVVNTMLAAKGGDCDVSVSDGGLQDVYAPNGRRLDPRQVIEVAARVMSPTDQVVSWRRDNQGYGFEVIQPLAECFGGDVNDISRGGLRFGQETKTNSAPWVQPYIFRLICTNGMEIPDEALKITSQGKTIQDVLDDLEAMAYAAKDRVSEDIQSFYHLKSVRVNNPEKVLSRYAREQGFNDRRTRMLLEALPQYEDEDGSSSQFDLVNAITNQANDPNIHFGAARRLQQAGGNLAYVHTARCPTCASKVA